MAKTDYAKTDYAKDFTRKFTSLTTAQRFLPTLLEQGENLNIQIHRKMGRRVAFAKGEQNRFTFHFDAATNELTVKYKI